LPKFPQLPPLPNSPHKNAQIAATTGLVAARTNLP
jgi:hypothetical protein